MRKLLTVPDDILRTPCTPVGDISPEIEELAKDLMDYMIAHREDKTAPIGLAAPQFGETVRLFVFYPNPSFRERSGIEVLINPELDKASKFTYVTETCLSIPGKQFLVRRAGKIRARGVGLNSNPRTYKGIGLLAQVLQHEVNHLDGVLIDSIGRRV